MKRKKMNDLLKQLFQPLPKDEVAAAEKEIWMALEAKMDKEDTSLRTLTGDGWLVGPVSELEYPVLHAVALVKDARETFEIHAAALQWVPKLTLARMYHTLHELEQKGFVKETPGEPKDGGGRYLVTVEGRKALQRALAEGMVLEPARAEAPVEDGATERPKP